VTVVAGHTSKLKRVQIVGLTADARRLLSP